MRTEVKLPVLDPDGVKPTQLELARVVGQPHEVKWFDEADGGCSVGLGLWQVEVWPARGSGWGYWVLHGEQAVSRAMRQAFATRDEAKEKALESARVALATIATDLERLSGGGQ